jgi:hypothetical protein
LVAAKDDTILKKMSSYTANLTGSDQYWQQRRSELRSIFHQKGSGTGFFTFSFADNHWDDLHRILPNPGNGDAATKRRNAERIYTLLIGILQSA